MLDKIKVFQDLKNIVPQVFNVIDQEIEQIKNYWDKSFLSQQSNFTVVRNTFPYSILAVDGSQIYPDRHQGISCFLINIGRAQFCYGEPESKVILDSKPFVISPQDESNIISTQIVDCYRAQYELKLGFEYSKEISTDIFCFLTDGSLIFYQLETLDNENKNKFLASYLSILDLFFKNKIFISGYISNPRSKEIIKLISPASQKFEFITDADLFLQILKPFERSAVFASKIDIVETYQMHSKIYFCYLHTGSEIARIELPFWIVQENQTDYVLGMILDQIIKGSGYPIALSESHEQAVVRAVDREYFYELLNQFTCENNNKYISSQKSQKKRLVGV